MTADKPPLKFLTTRPGPAPRPPGPGRPTVQWPAVAERMRDAATRRRRTLDEECELCGAEIASEHGHLADLPHRSLLCVCRPCYLLFTHEGAGGARFRAVPDRYEALPQLAGAADVLDTLQLPIGLAFFFRNARSGRVTAFYPSPAGATESELPLDAWDSLVEAVPVLATLTPDVEAVLVRQKADGPGADAASPARPADALIVPIDACYELVGRIRRAWQGMQGGEAVQAEIDGFFAAARGRSGRATPA